MIGTIIISGLALGAAGSLHCAGMCGPLCMMMPVPRESRTKKIMLILSYQFGRVVTYSFLGLLLGLLGRRFYIAGYQQGFSIVLGSVALALSGLYFFQKRYLQAGIFSPYYKGIQGLILRSLRKAGTYPGSFAFGMANGLLPCGMVYMAILATLSFSRVGESVGFMAMFGAGTIPMMFLAGYAGQSMKWRNRIAFQKVVPFFIILTGCILILRGLNLGIPFLSPQFFQFTGQPVNCNP